MKGLKKIKENTYNYKGYRIRRFKSSRKKGIPFVKFDEFNADTHGGVESFWSYVIDLDYKSLSEKNKLKMRDCSGELSEVKYKIEEHIKKEGYWSEVINLCKVQ